MTLSCDVEPLLPYPRGKLLVQLDPLNSPHPIPWNWILAAHNAALANNRFTPQHYRSAALRSPDGDWLAYSRINLELCPQLYACKVSSILLVENLVKGSLQSIAASSPFAQQDWQGNFAAQTDPEAVDLDGALELGNLEPGNLEPNSTAGSISILIPVSWNQAGEQLLARQFEARFCSSMATDYGLVWDRSNGKATMLNPPGFEQAVLLGWSQSHPQSVLFEAGELSQAELPRWLVDQNSVASRAETDEARTFGETIADVLTGPQTSLC